MKITIKDKEIELKYTLRSMLMFENIKGETFSPKNLTDIVTYMYCVVVASGKDYDLQFDDFIDYLDEHPEFVTEFTKWLEKTSKTVGKFKKK